MMIQVEAVFENGVFKPKQPTALVEGTEVSLTVRPLDEHRDPLEGVIGICDGPPDGAANHDLYLYGKRQS